MAVAQSLPASTAHATFKHGDASIHVAVTDQSGAVIQHARVSIEQSATATRLDGLTDLVGHFEAANLAPGPYVVQVSASGFKTVVASREIARGEDSQIKVEMMVDPRASVIPGPCCPAPPDFEPETIPPPYELIPELEVPPAPVAPPKSGPNRIHRFFSGLGHWLRF